MLEFMKQIKKNRLLLFIRTVEGLLGLLHVCKFKKTVGSYILTMLITNFCHLSIQYKPLAVLLFGT